MKKLTIITLFVMLFSNIQANNIVISIITLTDRDVVNHNILVNFDVTWDNSWRTNLGPSNWDAAWIFVKYRLKTSMEWHHATLHWVDGTGSNDGHTVPAGSTISSFDDNGSGGAYGVFIYANANMVQQTVNYTGAKLLWDYGVDGILDDERVEIMVLGIEMVYVPQGSFYAGDNNTSIYRNFEDKKSGNPFEITSEAQITLGGGGVGSMGNNNNTNSVGGDDDFNDATSKTLPAAFPKGFNAFYCMKYQVSQEQYAIFLNTLSKTQQARRTYATSAGAFHYSSANQWTPPNRNSIKCIETAGRTYACDLDDDGTYWEANDGQNIEANYMNPSDVMAYADWAGLSPMTELEFEKACRGTNYPVPGECAWGDGFKTSVAGISNPGAVNEVASNIAANCNYNNVAGVRVPMRCGALALAASTRREAGATLWHNGYVRRIMGMVYHSWEYCRTKFYR